MKITFKVIMIEGNMMDSNIGMAYEAEKTASNLVETKTNKFQSITKYILFSLTFLLPLFFIPNNIFPFQFGKILILSLGTVSAFVFWIVSQLKSGGLSLPRTVVFYSALSIIFVGLISSILSSSFTESVFGTTAEMDTLFLTIIFFLLLFVSSQTLTSSKSAVTFYLTLFASSAVLVVYQSLRVFLGADFLDFGILNAATSSLLGRWNDLGILFGFSTLVSAVALEFFSPTRLMKVLLYISIALSLLVIAVVNSLMVWSVIGTFSLALFIYLFFKKGKQLSFEDEAPGVGSKISFLALVLVILSILFIIFRSQVGGFIADKYNISQIEARPSLGSTIDVSRNVLSDNPGFGAGPNRFSVEWGEHKPLSVNNTIFWNVDFSYGIGIIPTSAITYGILGLLAWIAFLGSLVFLGIRALFSEIEDPVSHFVIVSSFVGTLYLWTFSVISVPGIVLVSMTFLMTGLFIAGLSKEGLLRVKNVSFSDDSKTGFVSVFVLVVLLIGVIGLEYMNVTRYVSSVYAQKALAAVNTDNDLDSGLSDMNKALTLAKTDTNYRLMSQLHVARLREVLGGDDNTNEETVGRFQEVLGVAILNAQNATEQDSRDHRNWMALGNIYEAIIPLGIEGSYESAKDSYQRAREVNPTNPSIDLALARIEALNGDTQAARENIVSSLQKKPNYINAIFLLSQIEINEGNIREATQAVEAASIINPNDTVTFFQLGFLKFSQRDFEGAIQALERSIALNPPYSNAKYFLGLSYYSVGRVEESIVQFEDIEKLNPENQEVKDILENLRNGEPPLLNIISSNSGNIEELPVQE